MAVISRGDDSLLLLSGRTGRHFPGTREGTYAGHHPADSQAAIDLLGIERKAGTSFLVIPDTSIWWLSHYEEFARHLEAHCRRVDTDGGECRVFEIGTPEAAESYRAPRKVS